MLAARRRPRLAAVAEVEDHIGHQFRADWSIRQIIGWAAQDSSPAPGAIVNESTREFAALVTAVRTTLYRRVPLRGGSEFTPIPVCGTGCGKGCH